MFYLCDKALLSSKLCSKQTPWTGSWTQQPGLIWAFVSTTVHAFESVLSLCRHHFDMCVCGVCMHVSMFVSGWTHFRYILCMPACVLNALTLHGAFLRGGGKRGLRSNATPCCPPSTLNVAPVSRTSPYTTVQLQSHILWCPFLYLHKILSQYVWKCHGHASLSRWNLINP